MWSSHLCILVVVAVVQAAKTKIGSLTTLCSRSDPKLNECATKSANQILPHLVKGVKDYGLPPLDPLTLPFVQLIQSDRPVGIKLNISDSIHVGIPSFRFTDFRFKDNNLSYYEFDVFAPRYSISGSCDIGGKILLLPITGHGNCSVTVVDFKGTVAVSSNLEKRGKATYFKFKEITTKAFFKDGQFLVSGLFGGNKDLGDAMNKFLNENALEVMNDMKPTLENVYADIIRALYSTIIDKVSLEEMFLP